MKNWSTKDAMEKDLKSAIRKAAFPLRGRHVSAGCKYIHLGPPEATQFTSAKLTENFHVVFINLNNIAYKKI